MRKLVKIQGRRTRPATSRIEMFYSLTNAATV
jgi:hypothetical protein